MASVRKKFLSSRAQLKLHSADDESFFCLPSYILTGCTLFYRTYCTHFMTTHQLELTSELLLPSKNKNKKMSINLSKKFVKKFVKNICRKITQKIHQQYLKARTNEDNKTHQAWFLEAPHVRNRTASLKICQKRLNWPGQLGATIKGLIQF